jgi:hypothetical protein
VVSQDHGRIDTALSSRGDATGGVAERAGWNGSKGLLGIDNLMWFGERFIERVGRGVEKTHAEKLRRLLDYR